MSQNTIQTSFAAGELAPSIFARTDIAKYHSGAATMKNFFVDYRSGASTRTGTKFVIQGYKSATKIRIIPFQYSNITTYVLEFGDSYIRFINNGAPVLETPYNITAVTLAFPAVATVPGHPFSVNDWVFVSSDIGGMIQLGGRFVLVTAISGNDLTLADVNGNPIDSRAYTAFASGGTTSRVYTLASPYAAADLALLKFVQNQATMTLTHPSYAPRTLTLVTATNWTLATITFGSTVTAPTGLSTATSAAGASNYSFEVTAVDANGQESPPSAATALAAAVNLNTTAGTISVLWGAVVGASSYNVYLAPMSIAGAVPAGESYGFIGFTTGTRFDDSGIGADYSTTPPIASNPFTANNPGCTTYFQQRKVYAASTQAVQTFWMSQPGFETNFNVSNPVQPNDAITGTITSLQVNDIKWMLPMPGGLIVGTGKGAWQVSSGTGNATTGAVTPINIVATPQAYNGASDVPPIVVNYDVIYVQAKGSIVRDLSYNIYANIYTGTDISILSNHLFYNHQITEWAYAEEPFKIVWAVREDGVLLSLTFVKEQEIYGWARHSTLGLFQSVASVTEGQVDAVYVVVKRLIGGKWVQYIERMANRTFPYGSEDGWCVDAGIQSGLTAPAANLTIDVSTGTAIFTADSAVFAAGSVGSILRAGGGIATVTAFISPLVVQGTWAQSPTATLPEDPSNTPLPATSGNWTLTAPATVFYGLDYLNGQTVSINADGNVVTPQVVTNGSITLASPATKVTAGLKFTADLQTMYLDTGQPTIQGKRKKIAALTVRVLDSRGLQAGSTFDNLVPIKELSQNTLIGMPIPLQTTDERIIMPPLWDVPGQICIRQENPMPSTVLGVIPEIVEGDTAK